MAPPVKKILDRPNIHTEKCLGYNMVRKCKASKMFLDLDDTLLPVGNGKDLFEQFVLLGNNYKGDTNFNAKKLEDFNSFRVKASGTIYLDGGVFNLWFVLYDLTNSSMIGNAKSLYGDDHYMSNNNVRTDWFLDVEITFYILDGSTNYIINGFYTHSNDHHNEKVNVSLVPIMGQINNITQSNLYFDFKFLGTDSCQLKDFSVDFIE